MTKKNKKKKRLQSKKKLKPVVVSNFIVDDQCNELKLIEFTITDEPVEHPTVKKLPKSIKNELLDLKELLQTNPEEAIPELKGFIENFPHVPVAKNYLTVAFTMLGEYQKVEEIIEEMYRIHPDYLFAKIQYAEICMRRKEFHKIPGIFENKFNLKLLYPERNVFHATEVIHFNGILAWYFASTGLTTPAEVCLKYLSQLEPDSPWIDRIEKKLKPSLGTRLIQRISFH